LELEKLLLRRTGKLWRSRSLRDLMNLEFSSMDMLKMLTGMGPNLILKRQERELPIKVPQPCR
jgi:hypothetical protein